MAADIVDPAQNPEFDPERVLLREEFVIDSEGVLSGLTYYSGDKFKFLEIFAHFALALGIPTLVFLVLLWINGRHKLNVVQDGRCEQLLGWKCPLNLSACEGIIPPLS